MTVRRMDLNRIPYLGAFAIATDKTAAFPGRFKLKDDAVGVLDVSLVRLSISRSPLIGILVAGNSNGIVCSELFELSASDGAGDLNVVYISGKFTAFGNLVLANDHGALVSPELSDEAITKISEGLGVCVERGTIAGFKNVGAVAVATNRGALLHPKVSENEAEVVQRVLGVPADVGTVCGGVKFLGLCVVANSNGALTGSPTTGPEMGRIESTLGFV